jgi:hypothetical protein
MRSTLALTTGLLLLLDTGVAKAADPIVLAETGGFLLGNAHRCGIPTERVGKMITTSLSPQFDRLKRHHEQAGVRSRVLCRNPNLVRTFKNVPNEY